MKTNFDFGFSSALVMRTPAYSYQEYKSGAIPLHDIYFRTAILITSPVVYKQLEKIAFDPERMTEKLKLTLLKYYNRMCYRSTPFGLFSGTGALNWTESPATILLNGLQLHTELSFNQTFHLAEQVLDSMDWRELDYVANGSLYSIGNEYRYLWAETDHRDYKRKFYIHAIERDELLDMVLTFCKSHKAAKAIIIHLVDVTDLSSQDSTEYVKALMEEQVLIRTLSPNLTGKNYLSVIRDRFERFDEPVSKIMQLQQEIENNQNTSNPNTLALLHIHKDSPLLLNDGRSPFYVNSRQQIRGGLEQVYQKDIMEGIRLLNRLLPATPKSGIEHFAEAFRKKFDRRLVPLLEALDPETGIDYNHLGAGMNTPLLLDKVKLADHQHTEKQLSWTATHQLLLNKYIETTRDFSKVLKISDSDLISFPENDKNPQLPPSLFAMFRLTEKELFLEQAGGSTATALLGRFTPIDKAIDILVKEIVLQEEQANPDVLFAELVYLGELHIANVDRRNVFRDYEIPIMTASGVDEPYQIHLKDLSIFAQGNEIWLWSLQHQKRVIPRLSSAYNSNRSDLTVFRFLADLQHQGIYASLHFTLAAFIPGQTFYPRVQYKNTILSLATWEIPAESIKSLTKDHAVDEAGALLKLCNELNIDGLVSLTEGDHQLVFDLEDFQHVLHLSELLTGIKGNVTLKEFPFTANNPTKINNVASKSFTGQFIAALYNKETVYHAPDSRSFNPLMATVQRSFIPGTDWYYFKIYCHPSRSNALLAGELNMLIQSFGSSITQWFYIRYYDTGHHLRVRIKLPLEFYPELYSRCSEIFQPLLDEGIISAFSTDTYHRELERYSPELIQVVEQHFYDSSELVLEHLSIYGIGDDQYEYYQAAFSSLDLMASIMLPTVDERERFFRKLYERFLTEFKTTDKTSEQLKATFRELKKEGCFNQPKLEYYKEHQQLADRYNDFEQSLREINNRIQDWEKGKRFILIGDLAHMHLNRVFTVSSRQQETVCHYCLSAYYHGIRSKAKSKIY